MRPLLVALALALGCAHDNAVALRIFDTRVDDKPVILDACDFWQIECFEETRPEGAITLILTDRGAPLEGDPEGRMVNGLATHYEGGCAPVVFSIGDPLTLAHELGHALGRLPDRPDGDNIMAERPGPRVTAKQRAAVRRGAERLALCWGGVDP